MFSLQDPFPLALCSKHNGLCTTKFSSLAAERASIAWNPQEQSVTFLLLPREVHVHILSFLDAASLCSLARTCSYMEMISSDHLLWSQLLLKDTLKWPVISHLSHPQVYQDANSDLHPKLVYRQCYSNHSCMSTNSFTSPITTKLKWFFRRLHGHIPKVLVFGSGLESLPFVRRLMWEESSPYKPIGLFPGKDGIGSGFCIEHPDGSPVNLVTLYTTIRAERKLLASDHPPTQRTNRLMTYEGTSDAHLTRAVSDLCRQADAFLLVIDANVGPSEDVDKYVLDAMLRSACEQTPILVINAATDNGSSYQPIVVADALDLCTLSNHPWQVRTVTLGSFLGLKEGLRWLLQKIK